MSSICRILPARSDVSSSTAARDGHDGPREQFLLDQAVVGFDPQKEPPRRPGVVLINPIFIRGSSLPRCVQCAGASRRFRRRRPGEAGLDPSPTPPAPAAANRPSYRTSSTPPTGSISPHPAGSAAPPRRHPGDAGGIGREEFELRAPAAVRAERLGGVAAGGTGAGRAETATAITSGSVLEATMIPGAYGPARVSSTMSTVPAPTTPASPVWRPAVDKVERLRW